MAVRDLVTVSVAGITWAAATLAAVLVAAVLTTLKATHQVVSPEATGMDIARTRVIMMVEFAGSDWA
jgi:hypothetical protein